MDSVKRTPARLMSYVGHTAHPGFALALVLQGAKVSHSANYLTTEAGIQLQYGSGNTI